MSGYYETLNGAEEYARTHSTIPDFYERDIQLLVDYLHPIKDEKILELGVGSGRDAKLLLQMLGSSYTGIDISYPMFLQARQNNEGRFLNLSDQNLMHLAFPGSTFDAIWAAAVFHHISPAQFREGLAEAHRVLRPGGHFFISVRSNGDFEEIDPRTKLTYYHYSVATLTQALDQVGFETLSHSQVSIPLEGRSISYLKMLAQKNPQ